MSTPDNTFTLTGKDIVNVEYLSGSAKVSDGQPFELPPKVKPDGPGNFVITFTAGRHKTLAMAQGFIAAAGGSQYTLVVATSGDPIPNELNFYFGLNLTVRLPSGGRLDNIVIYLGQGSDGIHNNWWLGSPNLINVNRRAILVGTQSYVGTPSQPSRIAWRATAEMSTSGCSLSALSPTAPTAIKLLDVWGEGRIVVDQTVTGFCNSLNLNLEAQRISNGEDEGEPIPQQVPVFNFDFPYFPIPDHSVEFVTVMGAPIVAATAKEIVRVLDPVKGAVILYNIDPNSLAIWKQNKGNLIFKREPLDAPFDEISFPNVEVYRVPGAVNKLVDHDEL